ncbi:MAG: hypothetical protein RQ723_13445 [Desulfuromonadales bacterium]|nr:hypothetical protein [Desulfuromonadales bacterium]
MRVQCVATIPSSEQVEQLGEAYREGFTAYPVHEGLEYIALGIGVWGGIVWVEVAMETEAVVSVPMFLFRITDPSPSSLWEIRLHADGALTLWPREFYEDFFHDRLSEGRTAEVEVLRRVQNQMDAEMSL